ncbi:MAG: hypothetical protein K0Q55_3829 [Verrucomicrobia bacterium]|nr:hypothetical protein [Verrucomicrobiota bacterium]
MTAALEELRHGEGFAVLATEADHDDTTGTAEDGGKDGIGGGFFVEEAVDDKVHIAHDRVYPADLIAQGNDIVPTPIEAEGVLDTTFHGHDFEQRVVQQVFQAAADDLMEIPEAVGLHQIRIVLGQNEIGRIFQEKIGDVVQVNKPFQGRGAKTVFRGQFVAKEAGGLGFVVDELGVLGRGIGDVMVQDEPVGLVEARFEGEIADPSGLFRHAALFPEVVVMGFEFDFGAVEVFRQTTEDQAGGESVQIAFMSQDNVGFGQFDSHWGGV